MTRLQIQVFLGLMMALAAVGLIAFVGSREETRMARAEQTQRAQAIETGADLYEIHCRSCHGAKGEGLGQMGPALNDEHFFTERLAEVGWQGTMEDYIIATTTTGRLVATRPLYAGDGVEVMTAWSKEYGGPLRDDQIREVADFVMNWQATALGEVELIELTLPKASADDPEAVTRGEQIFMESGCAGCHTIEGLNQAEIGPDLTHIAQVAATRQEALSAEEYIRESFLIPDAYFVEGYEPEVVEQTCGGVLSEQQLDELVAFLLTLK
jgi:mono/diheme cytochrome c family protein